MHVIFKDNNKAYTPTKRIRNILLLQLKKEINYLKIAKSENVRIRLKSAWFNRSHHLGFLQSIEFVSFNYHEVNEIMRVLKYCPNLKYLISNIGINTKDEKLLTSFYKYMTEQKGDQVNVFFYSPEHLQRITEVNKHKRMAYILSLAARHCYDVFYIYTCMQTNPLFFRYAMTSAEIINRSYKKLSKGLFLGMHTHVSGDMVYADICKIFPDGRLLKHPNGTDDKFRRDNKLKKIYPFNY